MNLITHYFNIYTIYPLFHEINIFSVFVRLSLAFVIGGIIGLERGIHSHPAGFRTHILICIAATLSTLTGQYISTFLAPNADPARLGAQVITGMGFIGAGTIFATGKHKIKGLTTAAGLWASACIGLTIGIGFYSAAFIGALLIFISLALLPKIEEIVYSATQVIHLYIEISKLEALKEICSDMETLGAEILEKHISSRPAIASNGLAFHITLRLSRDMPTKKFLDNVENLENVFFIEEI